MVDFERLVKNNTFLVDFADEMHFDLQQRNGQRIFGPPRNEACLELDYRYEVYIGNIPPDCFEDELLPLFSKIPQLYTFRLMLNFEGLCRGFAFAKYKSMESARRACNICNAFRVRYNARLRVVKCRNYSRIYIGEFATLRVPNFGTSLDPVLQVLYSQLVDMKTVSIYRSPGLETAYYVIEFYNHHKAALARRMLIARRTAYFAGDVAVDWVGQAILNMEAVTVLKCCLRTYKSGLVRLQSRKQSTEDDCHFKKCLPALIFYTLLQMFRRYGFRLGGYFQLG